jgi:hypothetical protein
MVYYYCVLCTASLHVQVRLGIAGLSPDQALCNALCHAGHHTALGIASLSPD